MCLLNTGAGYARKSTWVTRRWPVTSKWAARNTAPCPHPHLHKQQSLSLEQDLPSLPRPQSPAGLVTCVNLFEISSLNNINQKYDWPFVGGRNNTVPGPKLQTSCQNFKTVWYHARQDTLPHFLLKIKEEEKGISTGFDYTRVFL